MGYYRRSHYSDRPTYPKETRVGVEEEQAQVQIGTGTDTDTDTDRYAVNGGITNSYLPYGPTLSKCHIMSAGLPASHYLI
jgi:hypothetical protein